MSSVRFASSLCMSSLVMFELFDGAIAQLNFFMANLIWILAGSMHKIMNTIAD